VGLLSGLLTLPVAPVRGVVWVAERMLDEANTELSDPATIYSGWMKSTRRGRRARSRRRNAPRRKPS